jgi:heptosyltransferase-2
MGGCKRSIGFNRYFRKWLLSDSLESPQNAKGEFIPSPAIDSYNQLAMVAGAPNPGYEMQLFTSTVEEEMAEQVWRFAAFKDKPEVICLNPGAAFGASKLWPAEHFASLARELIRLRGAGILVMCGPKESELALRITSLIGHPSARCLAEPGMPDLSLGLSKACIKKCQLLVTTDSGPRHFAAAFNKPVVSLFGPTHIEWTDTYHKKEINLQKKLPCGPCQKRVCPLEHQCMKELMPLDVLSAGVSLLDQQLENARFLRSVG